MSSAGLSGTSDTDRTRTPGNDAMRDQGATPERAAAEEEALEEALEEMAALGGGEPLGFIEITEVETTEGGPEAEASRFRWWYVPAVALPVAACATAGAIWLTRRNRRQPAGLYQRLALQGRGLLGQVPFRRKARSPWQQGIATMRESAKGLPDQASMLREKSAQALAAIDTAALLEQTRGIWSNAADQMNSLWERAVPGARRTRRRARRRGMTPADMMRGQVVQMRRQLVRMRRRSAMASTAARMSSIAAMRAARLARRSLIMQNRINRWIGRQQERQRLAMAGGRAAGRSVLPLVSAAGMTNRAAMRAARVARRSFFRSFIIQSRLNQWIGRQQARQAMALAGGRAIGRAGRAVIPFAAAARSTRRGVRQTRRRVNRGIKQARAFSFGVLVASIVTYVRVWRTRLDERELRETAGGRMVRDPKGPVEAGALLP